MNRYYSLIFLNLLLIAGCPNGFDKEASAVDARTENKNPESTIKLTTDAKALRASASGWTKGKSEEEKINLRYSEALSAESPQNTVWMESDKPLGLGTYELELRFKPKHHLVSILTKVDAFVILCIRENGKERHLSAPLKFSKADIKIEETGEEQIIRFAFGHIYPEGSTAKGISILFESNEREDHFALWFPYAESGCPEVGTTPERESSNVESKESESSETKKVPNNSAGSNPKVESEGSSGTPIDRNPSAPTASVPEKESDGNNELHLAVLNAELRPRIADSFTQQKYDTRELKRLLDKSRRGTTEKNNHGQKPFDLAISLDREELALLIATDPTTKLWNAIVTDNFAEYDAAFSEGAETEVSDSCGETALKRAARYNKPKMIEKLIADGAKINFVPKANPFAVLGNRCGWGERLDATALDFAVINANVESVAMLLSYKADINIIDDSQGTTLHRAVTSSSWVLYPERAEAVLDLLIAEKPNFCLRNDRGRGHTPFELATKEWGDAKAKEAVEKRAKAMSCVENIADTNKTK